MRSQQVHPASINSTGLDYLTTLLVELQQEIMMHLSYNDIIKYCSTNRIAAKVCQDNIFWKNEARHEGLFLHLLDNISLEGYRELINYKDCSTDANTHQ